MSTGAETIQSTYRAAFYITYNNPCSMHKTNHTFKKFSSFLILCTFTKCTIWFILYIIEKYMWKKSKMQ